MCWTQEGGQLVQFHHAPIEIVCEVSGIVDSGVLHLGVPRRWPSSGHEAMHGGLNC